MHIKQIYGTAKWSYLSEPDEGFGSSKFHVVLEVLKSEATEHMADIKKIIGKEIVEQGKTTPNATTKFKEAPLPFIDNGETVDFKIHSQFKPKFFDRKGKALGEEVKIWKDSSMWITYKADGYNKSMGIGCTLYIQSGQIDQLVTGNSQNCPYPDRDEAEKTANQLKEFIVDDHIQTQKQ